MAGTNTTQFIFIKHGNTTDEAIDYFNSGDTFVTNFATTSTNTGIVSPIAIQADLTGGFYYIIDPQFTGDGSADGQIHLGKIATPTAAPTTAYTVPDNSGPGNEFSEANAIAIDTTNHVLYLAQVVYTSDLSGLDPQTGIVAFNYNPTTGALGSASPILTQGAPGSQATDTSIDEVAQLSLDSAHHVLYFTDDTIGKGFFVGAAETNTVKAYDLVTHTETTVVTFPSGSDGNVEFPIGYTNGTIEGVAADPTDNIVFFSTASGFAGSESLNSIYVILPNGGGLVKLAESSSYDSMAPFNLTFDDVHNKLYVSYESTNPANPGHLVVYDVNIPTPGSTAGITLSNPVDIGLSLQDPSGNVDYPLTGFLDQLPVLTTSGTATHAAEQGAGVTLLAPGTTVTDADQTQLVSATVKITGGTFSSNENSTADDHLGFTAANVTGDLINGTSIHFSYDAASETLTLTGVDTLDHYNLALSEVQYSTTGDNPTNYDNDATRSITWHVDDGAMGDPSGTNTTTTTLSIDAANDAPVATTPVAHYAATDQVNLSLKNTGLSVSDVDGGITGQNETVTMSVGEGTLTLGSGTSGAVIDSGNGTNSVTFHGTIAQLNALLNTDGTSTVIYNDNTDPPSAASTTLTLQINDGGNTGSGGPLAGISTATIDITATPMLSTTPSPDTVTLATAPVTLTDSATLTDGLNPTGTITFTLIHGATVVDTETVTVNGNGTYTAPTGFTLPSSGAETGTYQWDATYSGDANNIAASDVNNPNEQVTVSAAHPTLSTTPIPDTLVAGVPLKDTADLEGAFHPTGTITFTLFHNGDSTPVDTETVAVNGNGTYTTPTGFTPAIASGTYQWDTTYSGDANNTTVSDSNNPNEQVTVSHAPGAFDFNFDNNGNGHADILLQNGTGGAVSIWESAQPAGASTVATSVPSTWHIAGIGDFDGNGKGDILWESDSGSVAIWDNGVIGHTIATGVPNSWHIAGTGDFNGDGKSDILWQNDNGSVAVWDSNNAQTGHTVAGPGSMLPTNEHVVATGDIDGNGKTDILWQNTSNGALTLWSGENPATASVIATSVPSSWHVAGVGDFDGNGKSDILWQNDNGSVAIWDSNNAQTGHTIATGVPSSWHVAGVGDFNGDGKSDILWHNDNGAIAIWDSAQFGHTVAAAGTVSPDWHIIA